MKRVPHMDLCLLRVLQSCLTSHNNLNFLFPHKEIYYISLITEIHMALSSQITHVALLSQIA